MGVWDRDSRSLLASEEEDDVDLEGEDFGMKKRDLRCWCGGDLESTYIARVGYDCMECMWGFRISSDVVNVYVGQGSDRVEVVDQLFVWDEKRDQ